VAATHAYTTTVASGDGSFVAELISLPHYFGERLDPAAARAEGLERLRVQLGVGRGAEVTEASLEDLLQQIAYETGAARRVPQSAVTEVIREVVNEPIVVLERSPAVGTSLRGLVSQGAPAYIWIAEGKPFLALAVEAGIVVVWFIAGPIQGVREGLREAARDATKRVATELLERWLRERFSRRRRRGR
jgi:hypothetical protein